MLIILIPLLVLVVGALAYALSANGKVAELGRIAFFVGLFWLVYSLSSTHLHVLAG
jgi:Na+/phosphate symporter